MGYSVKVILDGKDYTLNVHDDETILDAAINADIDPPYACRVAACCTCKAKLIAGKVVMEDDEPLTEEEQEEGCILTCKSDTKQDETISYDEA